MPTPHNSALNGDIAETVLMPGDPLRAEYIAKTYFENPVCFNSVRGMLGFTGTYKGKRLSVMGSGMGMPSMGIYSYELFTDYKVQNIIRIGTAGGISENVNLRDVIIAQGSCTNSSYANQYGLPGTFSPISSYYLLERAVQSAKELGVDYTVGNILSSDTFYDDMADSLLKWKKMNVLAVEMESAALFMNAARLCKNALCIVTVSDCPLKGLSTSAEERQTSFTKMMEIALETALKA